MRTKGCDHHRITSSARSSSDDGIVPGVGALGSLEADDQVELWSDYSTGDQPDFYPSVNAPSSLLSTTTLARTDKDHV